MHRMLMKHRNVVAGAVAIALSAGTAIVATPAAEAAPGQVSAAAKFSTAKRYKKKSRSYKKYRTYKKYRSYKKYKRSYKRTYKRSYRSYRAVRSSAKFTNTRVAGTSGNRYSRGYCTWYAYERRKQMGKPVGGNWSHASKWDEAARRAGFRVDRTPSRGAVMQKNGGYGHVAVVESVSSNGSVTISEMNFAGGWNRVSKRTLSPAKARAYQYIH